MARFPNVLPPAALLAMAVLLQGVPAQAASPEITAIHATVTGHVQQVGFRALVMKQAITYNLAGTTRNNPDDSVAFTLQGPKGRIDTALDAIRNGTRTSSDVEIATSPAMVDPALDTFTIFDWTSTSRDITQPYTLVFRLRSADDTLPPREATAVWHGILKTTLRQADLRKLGSAG